jgi:hypothetical protein
MTVGTRSVTAVAIGLALGGCAAMRQPVALRPVDDAVATGTTRLYVLPDSAVAVGVHSWGQIAGDSLVLYRPVERLGPNHYLREIHHFGSSGLAVAGYTTTDGRRVEFSGWLRAEGERLHFRRSEPRGLEKAEEPRELVLAAGEVRSIDVWLPSASHTVAIWTFVVVAAVAAVGLAAAASLRESAM